MTAYRLIVSPAATRRLAKLEPVIRRRIATALDALCANPRPNGAVTLKGEPGLWRIRVGSYRVVYMIEDDRLVVLVLKLGHRRQIYRDR